MPKFEFTQFQFPSNGKAQADWGHPGRHGYGGYLFQFPSNGKAQADPIIYTPSSQSN